MAVRKVDRVSMWSTTIRVYDVRYFCRRVAEGRRRVAALADWFPGTPQMDSALSHWMVKRSHGGKPVVLRRNVLAR
jgi:hypothetical protein